MLLSSLIFLVAAASAPDDPKMSDDDKASLDLYLLTDKAWPITKVDFADAVRHMVANPNARIRAALCGRLVFWALAEQNYIALYPNYAARSWIYSKAIYPLLLQLE